ncbi:MAG: hypothetical protein V4561_06605 [Bacteroidota bacterium]
MKTLHFLALFSVLFIHSAIAQNTYLNYKQGLKIYNTVRYQESSNTQYQSLSTNIYIQQKSLQVLHPSVAYQWSNAKRNFHEIELSNFRMNRENKTFDIRDSISMTLLVDSAVASSTDIGLRYEYVINFCKLKNHRLVPSMGIGVYGFYTKDAYMPNNTALLMQSHTEFGVKTFLIPRINYYLSSKFFLDFNIPLLIINMSTEIQKINNPSFSAEQNNSSVLKFDLAPKYWAARIGLGMKI